MHPLLPTYLLYKLVFSVRLEMNQTLCSTSQRMIDFDDGYDIHDAKATTLVRHRESEVRLRFRVQREPRHLQGFVES